MRTPGVPERDTSYSPGSYLTVNHASLSRHNLGGLPFRIGIPEAAMGRGFVLRKAFL